MEFLTLVLLMSLNPVFFPKLHFPFFPRLHLSENSLIPLVLPCVFPFFIMHSFLERKPLEESPLACPTFPGAGPQAHSFHFFSTRSVLDPAPESIWHLLRVVILTVRPTRHALDIGPFSYGPLPLKGVPPSSYLPPRMSLLFAPLKENKRFEFPPSVLPAQ